MSTTSSLMPESHQHDTSSVLESTVVAAVNNPRVRAAAVRVKIALYAATTWSLPGRS